MKFPNSLILSAEVFFAFHKVRRLQCLQWIIIPLGLVCSRSFLACEALSNSRTSWMFELSGIDSFCWQCSGHCILTLIVSHNYALWTQLDPRFSRLPINKVVSNRDPANPLSLKHVSNTWRHHLFFITTCWPVWYHRIINPKKALQSTKKALQSVINISPNKESSDKAMRI